MKEKTLKSSLIVSVLFLSLLTVPALVVPVPVFGQEGHKCMHQEESQKKESSDHTCTITDAEKEMLKNAEKVTMTGKVLCSMCNLKTGTKCQSMFKDEASGKVYSMIDNENFHKITSVTKHGEKSVTITGNAAADADKNILEIETFEIKG